MMLATVSARPELTELLAALGLQATSAADAADLLDRQPETGWDVVIVDLGDDPVRGAATVRRLYESLGLPILAIADLADDVAALTELDDFIVAPVDGEELRIRLRRLTRTATPPDEVIRFKDLELNLATYQATVGDAPVDLTFMEYELLRFFCTHAGRVWSRAQILAQVWGYEYFGGARTVDVHVRRLRAKLGEERASWIATVRSVGYRFG